MLKPPSRPSNESILPIWQIISYIYKKYELMPGLNIEIWSDIPIGVGLGSSAAVSVATVAALNNLFELQLQSNEISQLAYEGEKMAHAYPSGIDNTISAYGGAILYKKGTTNRIEIPYELPLLIINSGLSRETKIQVNRVKNLYTEHPTIFKHVFASIDAISIKVENALRLKKLALLGDLLNYNHSLLQLLGVSTKELDSLIELVRSQGATGAKLTGAGGGGCIIALFDSESNKTKCINQLNSRNIHFFNTKISEHGAEIQYTSKN